MIRRSCALLGVVLYATAAMAAGTLTLKSPDKVKHALGVLAYVQADMASKLPSKAYGRLPHEVQEFREAAPALMDALAGDPPQLRSAAEGLLQKAVAAAEQVEAVSTTADETRITAAVAAVDAALQPLNQLFPPELRPVAGQLPRPGTRPPGGPPPELR